MIKKIYFDNCFFNDSFNDDAKSNILSKINDRKLILYVSEQLLIELLGIITTNKADKSKQLKSCLQFILDAHPIYLKNCFDLTREELTKNGFKNEMIFLDDLNKDILNNLINDILNGKKQEKVISVLDTHRKRNEENKKSYKTFQEKSRSYDVKIRGQWKKIGFEDYFNKLFHNHAKYNLDRHFNSIGCINPRKKTRYVLRHLHKFPCFVTFIRCNSAILYYSMCKDYKVTASDQIDIEQLVYFVGIDILITNDLKSMTKMFNWVWPNKEVYSTNEFLVKYCN